MKSLHYLLLFMLVRPACAQHHHPSAEGYSAVNGKIILQQVLIDSGLQNREIKGEIESVFDGKTYHYKQGEYFYEFTNGLHSTSKNTHPTQAAKLHRKR